MRLVLDTNTLISGSLWSGKPAQLLDEISSGKAELITSLDIIAEYEGVLNRQKFLQRLKQAGITPSELARRLEELATICSPKTITEVEGLRDPKDKMIVECALEAKVDAIVSGDEDLLILKVVQSIPIYSTEIALQKISGI